MSRQWFALSHRVMNDIGAGRPAIPSSQNNAAEGLVQFAPSLLPRPAMGPVGDARLWALQLRPSLSSFQVATTVRHLTQLFV